MKDLIRINSLLPTSKEAANSLKKAMSLADRNRANGTSIIIDNVKYDSINQAAKALGCSSDQLRRYYREFLAGSLSEKEVNIKMIKTITIRRP